METSRSLRLAALAAALGSVATGIVLLCLHPAWAALTLLPLTVGLIGLGRGKTWGGFATLGGVAVLGVGVALAALPAWTLLAGLAGVIVALPPMVRAFRFDPTAATVWLALASLAGSGGGLAWTEARAAIDAAPQPFGAPAKEAWGESDMDDWLADGKDLDDLGCDRWDVRAWGARVDVDVCRGHGPPRHRHPRRWRHRAW